MKNPHSIQPELEAHKKALATAMEEDAKVEAEREEWERWFMVMRSHLLSARLPPTTWRSSRSVDDCTEQSPFLSVSSLNSSESEIDSENDVKSTKASSSLSISQGSSSGGAEGGGSGSGGGGAADDTPDSWPATAKTTKSAAGSDVIGDINASPASSARTGRESPSSEEGVSNGGNNGGGAGGAGEEEVSDDGDVPVMMDMDGEQAAEPNADDAKKDADLGNVTPPHINAGAPRTPPALLTASAKDKSNVQKSGGGGGGGGGGGMVVGAGAADGKTGGLAGHVTPDKGKSKKKGIGNGTGSNVSGGG
ncbi:unnamed protein product, partial [Sphacelaria rigidula]